MKRLTQSTDTENVTDLMNDIKCKFHKADSVNRTHGVSFKTKTYNDWT